MQERINQLQMMIENFDIDLRNKQYTHTVEALADIQMQKAMAQGEQTCLYMLSGGVKDEAAQYAAQHKAELPEWEEELKACDEFLAASAIRNQLAFNKAFICTFDEYEQWLMKYV